MVRGVRLSMSSYKNQTSDSSKAPHLLELPGEEVVKQLRKFKWNGRGSAELLNSVAVER